MYFDHNATSPMPEVVCSAVSDAMANHWANPSSPHRLGQAAAIAVQRARSIVAERLGVRPKDVTFTSGATEANAWVLGKSSLPVLAASTEHPSVLEWADEVIPVDTNGVVDLDAIERRLRAGPALVSVMAANNETGVIQPIADVRRLCQAAGAPLHCDATQWVGRMPNAVAADWLTVSAHKLGGPRGVGALIGEEPPPEMLLRGGSQERGRRGGTLNAPGIIGFGVALEHSERFSSTERDRLEDFCRSRGAIIVGGAADRLPNTLCALFKHPGDMVVAGLDLEGIFASTGSACSSGSAQASHVLDAMGIRGVPVRFSLGPHTPAQPAIDALQRVLDRLESACA